MQAWFLAHFPGFFSVDPNTDYIENYPVAARWKLQKGHGEGLTYHSLLDHIQFDDVCWRSYEEHRETKVLRRFSGIQVGLCAVFVGCTITCLRGC